MASILGSILGRINLLFFLFFLLITVSVGATFWGLQAQAEDALVINLAGRQRMLVQQMTRLAVDQSSSEENSSAISFAITTFEATLQVLRDGGKVNYPANELVDVPPARDPRVRQQLGRVEETWDSYRAELDKVLSYPDPSHSYDPAIDEIQQLAPVLSAETDVAVRLFQADSRRRTGILRWVQVGFFLGAVALLGAGRLTIQRAILTPLKRLNLSTERIRSGDLQTPVQVGGAEEIRMLSRDFEAMRAELEHSQQELLHWTQELEDRVKQRTQELDALYKVSQEISSRLELRDLLGSITDKARELLQAETSFLCLLDGDRQLLSLQAISGPDETVNQISTSAQNPFVQHILNHPEPQRSSGRTCQDTCGIMADPYRTSHLAAPLCLQNRVIGALCVGHRQAEAFSGEHVALLPRMASTAAVALQNARLYSQAERVAVLEERHRIAAAMHDGLAQMIDTLGLLIGQAFDQVEASQIDQAEKILKGARERVSQASVEVRRSISSLEDEPIYPRTIQEQLKKLIQELSSENGAVQWVVELEGALILPNEDAQQILGIAQEALLNARRHSGANRISIRLNHSSNVACLIFEDNGSGFDPSAEHTDGRKHFGLKILQARSARIGGSLEVHSAPGNGTCISLTWPVRKLNVPVSGCQEE